MYHHCHLFINNCFYVKLGVFLNFKLSSKRPVLWSATLRIVNISPSCCIFVLLRYSDMVAFATAPGRYQLRKVSKAVTVMVQESISRFDTGKSFPILSTISLKLLHIDLFWMTLSTSSRVSLEELSSSILFIHLLVFSLRNMHFHPFMVSDIRIARLKMLFSGLSLHKLRLMKVKPASKASSFEIHPSASILKCFNLSM